MGVYEREMPPLLKKQIKKDEYMPENEDKL